MSITLAQKSRIFKSSRVKGHFTSSIRKGRLGISPRGFKRFSDRGSFHEISLWEGASRMDDLVTPVMTSCDDSDETTGKTDYLVDNSWYLIEYD